MSPKISWQLRFQTILSNSFGTEGFNIFWKILNFGGLKAHFCQKAFFFSYRLYRRRCLRPNTRWKPLDEIYKFHILLLIIIFKVTVSKIFVKTCFLAFFEAIFQIMKLLTKIAKSTTEILPNFSIRFQGQKLSFNLVSYCNPSGHAWI